MIAKLILSSLFALFAAFGLMDRGAQSSMNSVEGQHHAEIVKAIVIDGEAVPHVDLPVVEITAPRNTANLVTADIINGEVVPVIHLDEVIITPGTGLNSI